ncbi:flagellar hook protein FlgE [Piscinibacter koreensis]|uniref:Flagellar hook protein FlgE n=1 Tax=Piscinibacter koreensis TaxID=2742824 RepID=A0A7Y6NP69_9BURK|nr:flagellar hook protein FlgE [Schlegelella koreensis]NUZ06823.1 flagellar hook protein FlgE [Schlegelella koreensis]
MGFQQGLSGLNAAGKSLEAIGNNIANANTYGAKSARAEFADMYAGALAGGNTIGIGVTLAKVSQQFTQGSISTTGNPLDLAINGAGFFQVLDKNGETAYTRNGAFKVDRDGYVENNQGQRLIGFPADATGAIIPGFTSPLQMPTAGITPAVTSTMKMELNLDARESVTAASGGGTPINFADPKTYNRATSTTIYDAKGQDVALTYYFQKTATDTWDVYVAANGVPVSTSGGNPTPSTTITFPSDGRAPTAPTAPVTLNIPSVTNAAGAVSVPITGIQLNVAGTTQYGSQFGVTALQQNGYGAGQLTSAQFEGNGIFTAYYSNGQSKAVGQVAIANFRNPQGLTPSGGNAWSQSFVSGDPIVGVPGEGNLGSPQAGALEDSNIDMTAQLVEMITAQRFYQANSQTIKTQDQILQTIVNLR